MYTYALVIEIPPIIKNQLATLFFGPPQIKWIEKNQIYFLLRFFGDLSDAELKSVVENLEKLFFHAFTLKMQGVRSTSFKGKGIIGIEPDFNPSLKKLNKDMEQLLRKLNLKKKELPSFPLILGYYEKLDFERLSDYLMAYSAFEAPPIETEGLSLVRIRSSLKGPIYEEIAYYPASHQEMGED